MSRPVADLRREALARTADAPTRLAYWRVLRGMTQSEMSKATGISIAQYRRLDRGTLASPSLRHYANCAYVLQVSIEQLLEPAWRWTTLAAGAEQPEHPQRLWRPNRWGMKYHPYYFDEGHDDEINARVW
jgi:transcriptional regulator with XRE-family HTH domain